MNSELLLIKYNLSKLIKFISNKVKTLRSTGCIEYVELTLKDFALDWRLSALKCMLKARNCEEMLMEKPASF